MSLEDSVSNKTKRFAALDMGSNTLRYLLADVGRGHWSAVERGLATPRLGRGLKPGQKLAPEARLAAQTAAADFCGRARRAGASRVVLAATQACRVAADGADFVAELGQSLGLDRARAIDGATEAALSRLGVRSRLSAPSQGALLADVGGASTEVIDLAQGDGRSLAIGAVSLTEAYLADDPPTAGQLAALDRAVRQGLAALTGAKAQTLVATAGTAATVAAMVLEHGTYKPDEINNLVVGREVLESHFRRLAAMPLAQRRCQTGLEPKRADIILAGMAILRGLLDLLGLNEMITMDAGLLEGILLDEASIEFFGEPGHEK